MSCFPVLHVTCLILNIYIGDEVEVEEYVDPDEIPEEELDELKHNGNDDIVNRRSFAIMRERMKAQVWILDRASSHRKVCFRSSELP